MSFGIIIQLLIWILARPGDGENGNRNGAVIYVTITEGDVMKAPVRYRIFVR